MHNKKKILFYTFIVLSIIFSANYFFQQKINYFKHKDYLTEVSNTSIYLKTIINAKQKASMAIAVSLSYNTILKQFYHQNNFTFMQKKFYTLTQKLRINTEYKNVWIQLIDKKGISLVRSWTTKHNDSLANAREDIKDLIKNPRPLSNISVGKFTISFKSIMPIYDKDKTLLGFIEVITHFNSIIKTLKNMKFETVLLVDKRYKKTLEKNSLTKNFIEEYYIANFKFNTTNINFIKDIGIKKILSIKKYQILNNKFILTYPIYDLYHHKIAYFILTKEKTILAYSSVKDFLQFFKIISIIIFLFFTILIIFSYQTQKIIEKEKNYFKKIIDSTSDIIIISTLKEIIDVNHSFFHFFNTYKTLDDFKKIYGNSIANLFKKEEGFISKTINNISWIQYILADIQSTHKIKINYNQKIYYFYIQVKTLEKENNHLYTIVLTDITDLENSKNKLEHFSKTDALTNIGNRYFFNQEINKLFKKALYENNNLSLIMLDIDFFKKVNDTYGHDIGDKVLIELTKKVKHLIRDSDIFCRYGGEEFIIIMPHCTAKKALEKAEYIRKIVEKLTITPLKQLTISLGVTEVKKEDTIESMIKRVDKALYYSKENGRNRVTLF